MASSVIVIGGGYGGAAAARAIDQFADVVLVEPRDRFVHNVAALRALVEPAWAERIFLPYDHLLVRGRRARDRAQAVDSEGVLLRSGERLRADYLVIATGSTYPFPAKTDLDDSRLSQARIREAGTALADARGVLLLGAGGVGLELAGEIKAAWPAKAVTIVDPAPDILTGGLPDELRTELRRQLDEMGVELAMGSALAGPPPTPAGQLQEFEVSTLDGKPIAADIWFRCYGVAPASTMVTGDLLGARRADGYLEVTAELRLLGQEHVFALGDVTAVPEAKMAAAAGAHAAVVADNLRALITGHGDLRQYEPGPPGIALPLGPRGCYLPGYVGLLDAAMTAQIKGEHMMLERFAEMLGSPRA